MKPCRTRTLSPFGSCENNGDMMMNASREIGSAALVVLGLLAMAFALFLAMRGVGFFAGFFGHLGTGPAGLTV